MWQYTNTIVLNSLRDEESGLPKIVKREEALDIRRVNLFKKANVCAIYKRKAEDAVAGSVTINISKFNETGKNYRIILYGRLSGSQNSYYANDFVFKGKPFVFEIPAIADIKAPSQYSDAGSKVAYLINKVLHLYGDKFLKVEGSGNNVTFTGDNYVLFTIADGQVYSNATANTPETTASYTGTWTSVMADGDVTVVKCNNGFGTYEQIIKDLRLPTMEARRWEAVNKEELPIPGEKYDQFIIEYGVERGIMGGSAVGQLVKSKTTHVFFVRQDISAEFEADLAVLGTVTTGQKPLTITGGISNIELVKEGTAQNITPVVAEGTVTKVTATTNAKWITIAPSSTKVSIGASQNDGTTVRSAEVTVFVTDETGATVSQVITVTQKNNG